jgi:enoyl-CoA hydratase/carnithine racemase
MNMNTVTLEKDGDVGVVTLCKPPHNLLNNEMLADLADAYKRASETGCRAILLRSSMRHFCAGADLDVIYQERPNQATLAKIWSELEDVPIPMVAAVHGAALGGGLELALMCDMIIAADTASFAMAESALGLLPLLGGVQRMVQRIGPARGKEMAMFGRRHDPRALERWGAINLVTPEQELGQVSMSWARQLAAGPTPALKGIKKLADLAAREGVAGADAHQYEVNDAMWISGDQKRGLAAFAATGRPATAVFEGS